MSTTLARVQTLAARGEVRVSAHGYDELAADGLLAGDVIGGLGEAIVVEDYPSYPKGPCVLVLQTHTSGAPIHVVWGIPAGKDSPGVLITAYRPDPNQWDETFRRRRQA
ncbi:MAG: DUF4258 domain-containing protein [Gemmatimonadota bacterium]